MSWEDRDYAGGDDNAAFGRPGGDWRGVRSSFDNPFTWSLTLGSVGGITVRVHIFFLIFIVIMLLREVASTGASSIGFALMALSMACLFIIVLAHEFGHCIACRWMEGQADEILMWPLGGLAYCRPAQHWRAHFITVVGGPAVNVIICILAGGTLGLLTGRWFGVALPNPMTPFAALSLPGIARSWAHMTLVIVNDLSLLLLIFNLLPIFPLDGGRIVQSLLWPRFGYTRSMHFAVRTGYVGGIALGIFGLVFSQWMIVGIAIFGIVVCYITHRQLKMMNDMLGFEDDQYAMSVQYGQESEAVVDKRAERKALRRAEQARSEAAEIDRILQKIADSGMNSLTRSEKRQLKKATDRKRHDT